MNCSGHGLVDLASYDAYLSGKLVEASLADDDVLKLVSELKRVPG